MIIRILTLIIFLLLLSFPHCKRNDTIISEDIQCPDDKGIKLNDSNQDTLEAQKLGLWFSGDLLLSDSIFSEMFYSINHLRNTFGDSFSVLSHRFIPPWKIGELSVKFNESTADQVRNHHYTGWNSLKCYLQPDTILKYPSRLGWALLGFEELLNPKPLSEIYSSLPGVIYSEPNGIGFAGGGGFPIYPGYLNGEMTYLFVLDTYIPQNYFYFKYIDQEAVFIGHWDRSNQPQPDWWDEAKMNIENFHTWDGP